MKINRLGVVAVLSLGLWLALFTVLSTAQAAASIRYVATTGNDLFSAPPFFVINFCTDSAKPCATAQWAIDQSTAGDEIRVATGVYTGVQTRASVTQVVYISKTVTVRGGYTTTDWITSDPLARPTTLDAQSQGRVMYIAGNISPTIEGLRLINGDAAGQGGDPGGTKPDDAGGGIYSTGAAPQILNNVIMGSYGCNLCLSYGKGGGIYLLNAPASAVISGNIIADNVAAGSIWGQGGGIALRDSSPQVIHNTIQRNRGGTVGNGGGIAVWDGRPTISHNDILYLLNNSG